jgi:hypothetical protein
LKTLSGPVLYTNILGLWPFLVFAYFGGEYSKFFEDVMIGEKPATAAGICLLLTSSAVGIGIGYSGWWCRDKVAATSFTLIGVINKCLTVLLNLIIWDQHAGTAGIASLLICLVGGVFYQQAPLRTNNSTDTVTGSVGGNKVSVDTQGDEEMTSDNDDNTKEMEPLFERKRSTV